MKSLNSIEMQPKVRSKKRELSFNLVQCFAYDLLRSITMLLNFKITTHRTIKRIQLTESFLFLLPLSPADTESWP